MKQRKLTFRLIVVALVLVSAAYFLYPTLRYEALRTQEQEDALWISEQMGVSYSYVIENIYKDQSILRDKLEELDNIKPEDKTLVSERLLNLQGPLQDKALKYRKKAIKRGLDLQGGMHLVLEVDLVEFLHNAARQRDTKLSELLAEIEAVLNRDPTAEFNSVVMDVFEQADINLSQYFGEAGESPKTVLEALSTQADDAINRSLEILRNRIDQFGVSEPSIQKQGARRIILELPGVQDPSRARDLIGRTALLEFKLLVDPEKSQEIRQEIDDFLKERAEFSTTTDGTFEIVDDAEDAQKTDKAGDEAAVETTDAEKTAEPETDDAFDMSAEVGGDSSQKDTATDAEEIAFDSELGAFTSLLSNFRGDYAVSSENMNPVRTILSDPEISKIIPGDVQFIWSAKPEVVGSGEEYYILYIVKSNPELTGSGLEDASVDISQGYNNPGTAGQSIVSLTLNRAGSRKFSRVTGANIGKRLAIVLDDRVYMAPAIRSKIPNGRAIIEGSGSVDEANDIAIVLRAGALPTSVIIEEERTVGPSLGHDSIRKGTTSAVVGLVIVLIFMIIYYGLAGVIANVALLLNIVLIFAGLSFFGAMGMGATLSLPGIAGIILTIGMAVDANVLIFERIREELETGKSVWHAVDAGYSRAFTTILDANVTTMIAALVLLNFGSGPIKGFAVTLSIGIAASLFTAIVVTRLIFDYITSRKTLTRLSI